MAWRGLALVLLVALTSCAPAGSTTAPDSTEPQVSWGRLAPAPVMFGREVLAGDGAGHFTEVTPAHQPTEYVDDAFFVDHDRGWVSFTDSGAATARLFRTDDGGRTWEPVHAGGHRHQSAGSRVWLFFVDARTGWTVSYAASAPAGGIRRTSDGGVTWSEYTRLPEPGTVRFVSSEHGWLAGSSASGYHGRLYETFDGGVTWKQRTVPPPAEASADDLQYRLPSFDGSQGVLPVYVGRNRLSFYATSDGGDTWQATGGVAAVGGPEVSVAIASLTAWWVLDADGSKAWVTTDGGRTWTIHRPTGLGGLILQFEAKDGQTAWASAADAAGLVRLYGTDDGGETWRPLP
ncbi:MAG TPA: YCF48-related protein [Acidimicrobiia bacterium]|nr:YCF48-related protein [Acidimicrobiia bacterium]